MKQNSSKFKQYLTGFTLVTTILISANASAEWSIYGLGSFGGSRTVALDINNSGQIVGSSFTASSPSSGTQAFITGPNGIGMTALGTLGGGYSVATGINDSGQVTGYSGLSTIQLTHSFITGPNGIGMTDLGALNSYYNDITDGYMELNFANDINESGQVVGEDGAFPLNNPQEAFMTGPNGIGMTRLDITGYAASSASAINDSGQIVGSVVKSYASRDSNIFSFITGPNGTGLTIIEGLSEKNSWATGINNSGQVVGVFSTPGSADSHAFVTGPNGVGITNLGTLGGTSSFASDINESGQIIGNSLTADGSYNAFLYSDGEMLDLSLLPAIFDAGWTNLTVRAINDLGQIVGEGKLDGHSRAFLLSPFSIPEFPTPVPEPQTYVMLLAGLGLLGFVVRRRKELAV